MKKLYYAFHSPFKASYNHDPYEVVAFQSEAERDQFIKESFNKYTNVYYYSDSDLSEIKANLNFGVFDNDEFWDYAQDAPYTWWHYEPRKTESEIDTFNNYEQLAKATQLKEIANAYDRVAW